MSYGQVDEGDHEESEYDAAYLQKVEEAIISQIEEKNDPYKHKNFQVVYRTRLGRAFREELTNGVSEFVKDYFGLFSENIEITERIVILENQWQWEIKIKVISDEA